MRRILIAAAACGLCLLAIACSESDSSGEVEFRVPVTVQAVETGAVEDRIVTTGTLRAPETVSLRADTSGVLRIGRKAGGGRLNEGDNVRAGDTIAEVTGEDVRVAARTDATRQAYEAAQRDFESAEALHGDGLISASDLRQAETTLAQTKIDWERSRLTEDRSRLVTPISGVILRLARDEQGQPLADGQLVPQGTLVAQVAPVGDLIADVDLIGEDVTRVRPGMQARVRHQAGDGDAAPGKVRRVAPALDPATRTLRAEVALVPPAHALRPGMFVEVTIVVDRREGVAVVPRTAVTERAGHTVVFVLDGQRVQRRDVDLGWGDDDEVEILRGVEAGERVAVQGLETLTDGQRVRVSGA